MNILPKKKWHVRTKENMARVRRDEAKAAEEEERRLDRSILAENERRLEALRSKADDRLASVFGKVAEPQARGDASISAESGHVNLFQDLEREERKNLGTGNKDYEEEKKKEQQEWESKMGIQKKLGEGTNELDHKAEWYESMPFRKNDLVKPQRFVLPAVAKEREVKERELKREETSRKSDRKKGKRKHKKRKRSSSSSSSSSDDERRKKKKKSKKRKRKHNESSDDEQERKRYIIEKNQSLAALREERIQRERLEKSRTLQLLCPEQVKEPTAKKPKYNSQFNPDLCRN